MSIPASRTEAGPLVAVYDSHVPVESITRNLSRAGFDMGKVSIVGKRYRVEEHPLGFYSTGDRIVGWDDTAGFWCAIWSLLAGPAVTAVPQVGLVAAAGPFGLALIAAGNRPVAAGGVSALVAALVSQGIHPVAAVRYEADVKAHRFLVLVHDAAAEIAMAHSLRAVRPGVAGADGRRPTPPLA